MTNMNTPNWTGRTPRTCEEAFGPYCSMHLPQRKKKGTTARYIIALCIFVATVILWGVK